MDNATYEKLFSGGANGSALPVTIRPLPEAERQPDLSNAHDPDAVFMDGAERDAPSTERKPVSASVQSDEKDPLFSTEKYKKYRNAVKVSVPIVGMPEGSNILSEKQIQKNYLEERARDDADNKKYGRVLTSDERDVAAYADMMKQGGNLGPLIAGLDSVQKQLDDAENTEAGGAQKTFDAKILPGMRKESPTQAAIFDYLGVGTYNAFLTGVSFLMRIGQTYDQATFSALEILDGDNNRLKDIPGLRFKDLKGLHQSFMRDNNLFWFGAPEYGAGVVDLVGAAALPRAAARVAVREVKREASKLGRPEVLSKVRLTLESIVRTEATQKVASKAAAKEHRLAAQILKQWEEATGIKVTQKIDGGIRYAPEAARDAGLKITKEIADMENQIAAAKAGGASKAQLKELQATLSEMRQNKALFNVDDNLTSPILDPEKFNSVVAVAADLKKQFPNAFKNKKTVVDNLFDLTVKGDLTGDGAPELMETLAKYGLSFDDYVLTVVSGGSQAGKILNKLSQLRRYKPGNEIEDAGRKAGLEAQGSIRNFVMRVENIRRGLLVSQIKTAVRNFSSAFIRSPLEAVQSVMETSLKALADEGVGAAARAVVSRQNWRDSFRMLKYMYADRETAKIYSDFILGNPKLANQLDLMYNNLNEIQLKTGRGSGTVTDKVLTEMEDLVAAINIPNRWQEMVVRRGAFFGELQRLTRREYGIDLMEAVNQGKLNELLKDSPALRPKGARPFTDLVAESTQRALDITYAKQPDITAFKDISTFITRNGLTVVAPFPRFMFNSMELIGQYAGGASIPLTKMMTRVVKRGMGKSVAKKTVEEAAKDRQRISRNVIGMAAIGAAIMYRDSEDAPADYKKIRADDGTVIDTTPQFPLRQLLFIGEFSRQLYKFGFDGGQKWFLNNTKEFAETFAMPVRSGVGGNIVEEFMASIVKPFTDPSDLVSDERAAKSTGRMLGNYLRTWAVPLQQIIDLERSFGERGTVKKDVRKDPQLDFVETFKNEITRPFLASGIGISAKEEAALPERTSLFSRPGAKRVSPLASFALGLTIETGQSEAGEFLSRLMIKDWEEGSKSRVPAIQRLENNIIKLAIPTVVENTHIAQETFKEQWDAMNPQQRDIFPNKDNYVREAMRNYAQKALKEIKGKLVAGISGKQAATAVALEATDEMTQEDMVKRTLYLQALLDYRRRPPEDRRDALRKFVIKYSELPDASDPKDLTILGVLAGKKPKTK